MQEKGANAPERRTQMQISKVKIEVIMAQKGLNQTELSEHSKIGRARLSAIINGKNCRPSTIAKLANALRVDVKEIIDL